ncbi:MAG: ubiquinone/menaquinone biosynthesis protein [Gammaproteobacteria bacterium]|nr:ubiquinone/menaquinone biosynthesis protein [Gammaproteobacteria bacterium]
MSSALPPTSDDRIVWDTWLSIYRLPIVTVADAVGLFSVLAARAMTTDELAVELDVNGRALQIHLGVLAAMGFVERRLGRWRATAATRTWMIPEATGYCGPVMHFFVESQPLHAQLLSTLKTGARSGEHRSSADEWEAGEMSAELAQRITAYMNAHSQASARAVARQPVFGELGNMLDVGGGSGIFSIEVAKAWPTLKSTIMDIDVVGEEAARYVEKAGVADRVTTLGINMFEQPWPQGYDAHFLSNIFHDWSDDSCRMLARKSFDALPSGGRILLHEMLVDDDGCGPLATTSFSLLMLLSTKGRQYTLRELQAFLESAGFVDVEATQTGGGYYSLVSARKP